MIIKCRGWHFPQQKMYSAEEMARDQLAILPTGQFINVNGTSTKLSTIFPLDVFLPLQYIWMNDRDQKEIYVGDIAQIQAEDGKTNTLVVKAGIVQRMTALNLLVDIPAFYFENVQSRGKVFPIVNNYKNVHDLTMLTVVGNIYENPELLGMED